MSTTYRFHLQKYRPGSKIDCPLCHRHRCFTRYVDEEGRVEFPAHVGRCDHLNTCGYHFTPKMHFADHPLVEPKGLLSTKAVVTPRVVLPSVMETALMGRSLTAYHRNPLFRWMSVVMGVGEAWRLFQLYNVGTSRAWGGSTVFWQVDHMGRVRAGKVMGYDDKTGHRIKEPESQVVWAHTLMGVKMELRQCLFGEHLLRDNQEQQIIIVESEKTALIGAWIMPDFIWLATGGVQMLRTTEALRDRDVILIPDLGAEDTWRAKMPALREVCRSVISTDLLAKIATDEQRQLGLDIADFILMDPTVGMVEERMKLLNPHMGGFISLSSSPITALPSVVRC